MNKNQTVNLRPTSSPKKPSSKPDTVSSRSPTEDTQPDTTDHSSEAVAAKWSGRIIGEYEIGKQIGAGGTGRVFEARHRSLDMPVALKVLNTIEPDEATVNRFRQEAMATAKLVHPNLVRATDAGIVGNNPFLVTDFVDGADLRVLVNRHGVFDVANVCELGKSACEGLEFLTQRGIVHRDIKPSNIMVDTAGHVRILDLGLAASSGNQTLTMDGQIMGTLDFISPEQATDPRDVDFHADMYSMGCTLYFLLAGMAPFEDESYETVPAKLLAHVSATPVPIQKIRKDIPRPVAGIVMAMLGKRVKDRPASFEKIIKVLKPYSEGHNLGELVNCDPGPRRSDTGAPKVTRSIPNRKAERKQPTTALLWGSAFLIAFLPGLRFLGSEASPLSSTKRQTPNSAAPGRMIVSKVISVAEPDTPARGPQPKTSKPQTTSANGYKVAKNYPQQQLSAKKLREGDYVAASRAAYEALSLGDAWNWYQLVENFSSRDEYFYHLNKLEKEAENNPTANTVLLLAYHQRMLNHKTELPGTLTLAQTLMKRPLPRQVKARLTLSPAKATKPKKDSTPTRASRPARMPPLLNDTGRSAWQKYVMADSHKAWVHNAKTGNFGYATKRQSKARRSRQRWSTEATTVNSIPLTARLGRNTLAQSLRAVKNQW